MHFSDESFCEDIFGAFPSVLGAPQIAPSILFLWTIAAMDNRREPVRVGLADLFGTASAFLLSYLRLSVPEFPS